MHAGDVPARADKQHERPAWPHSRAGRSSRLRSVRSRQPPDSGPTPPLRSTSTRPVPRLLAVAVPTGKP